MEEKKKNELGNIYGSRLSQNGKWLNLLIVTHINGKEERITCPVRMVGNEVDGKPFAKFHLGEHPLNGELDKTKAMLLYIPVYEDKKPNEETAKAEDGGVPF